MQQDENVSDSCQHHHQSVAQCIRRGLSEESVSDMGGSWQRKKTKRELILTCMKTSQLPIIGKWRQI